MGKIDLRGTTFGQENLTVAEVGRRVGGNVPSGEIKTKWTGGTVGCLSCDQKSLGGCAGGVNVDPVGDGVTHAAFMCHCRICDLGLTEEEYQQSL